MNNNVIMVSAGRCGASWACAVISEIHKEVYGVEKHWNWGISRYMAINDKYYFPEGFNEVLYVDPMKLLNRPYDKIIVLKRELDEVLQSMQVYRFPELTYKETEEQYPQFIEDVIFYYGITYNHDFDDPRMYLTNLSDLNNHTVAAFSELLDFLEYPTHTYREMIAYIQSNIETMDKYQILEYLIKNPLRGCLIPINPKYRNWEMSSGTIPMGHGLNPMQIEIQKNTKNSKYVKMREQALSNERVASTQFLNDPFHPNPYKLCPEEFKLQKARAFRIYKERMPDALEILGML